MDQIGKAIEQSYHLGLTPKQSDDLDLIFRDYMREYHFPTTLPINDGLFKFNYFRKALSILTPDQLKIFREKKLQNNAKKRAQESLRKERSLTSLANKYKSGDLSKTQLETIYSIQQSRKKKIIPLADQHTIILNALNPTLSDKQRSELEKIFSNELIKSEEHKISKLKSQYEYLNLSDSQAREISILEENNKLQLRKSEYRGYDPHSVNPNFEKILTKNQYALYKSTQENLQHDALISRIKEDSKKKEKLENLEVSIKFHIETILPIKCKIKKQLIDQASKNDLIKIEELLNKYDSEIEQRIKNRITLHHDRYGTNLPNQLRISIAETAFLYINPTPGILKDLDLNQNMFASIDLNENQQATLSAAKLKIRDFYVDRFEKSSRGSYASLITSLNRNADTPKFYNLYSTLLVESTPDMNYVKMKKLLKANDIES